MILPQMMGLWVWACPKAATFRLSVQWPVTTALPSRAAPCGTILTQLNPLSSGFWKWDTQGCRHWNSACQMTHRERVYEQKLSDSRASGSRGTFDWQQQEKIKRQNCHVRDAAKGRSGRLLQVGEGCLTAAGLHFGLFWLVDAKFSSFLPTSLIGLADIAW